jgi:hypothetical protein
MSRSLLRLLPATTVLLCLLGEHSALAQGSGSAAITAATVVVRSESTGFSRSLTTDSLGRFSAQSLTVGSYVIEASSPGFAAQTASPVQLTVGQTAHVEVKLGVAAVAETLTVTADTARIDTASSAKAIVIDPTAVANLPIRGRNFVEFAQLAPNVMQEANRGGLVVNGQRSINSNISIDGVDFNDSLQGNQRGGNDATFSFPQSAVQEFQVATSGVSAEIGRTNAGFVNVVTKSGTNAMHGEGFYGNRNENLTSADAFGNPSKNNSQHQFGGAFGGPI